MGMYDRKALGVSTSDLHASPQHANPMPDIRLEPNRWLKAPDADFYHGGVPMYQPVIRPATTADSLTGMRGKTGTMAGFFGGSIPPPVYNDTTQFFGGQGGGNNYTTPIAAPGNTSGVMPSDPSLASDPTQGVPNPTPTDTPPTYGNPPVYNQPPTYNNPPVYNQPPPTAIPSLPVGNSCQIGSTSNGLGLCVVNTDSFSGNSGYNPVSIGGNNHGFWNRGDKAASANTSDFYQPQTGGAYNLANIPMRPF